MNIEDIKIGDILFWTRTEWTIANPPEVCLIKVQKILGPENESRIRGLEIGLNITCQANHIALHKDSADAIVALEEGRQKSKNYLYLDYMHEVKRRDETWDKIITDISDNA